MFFRAASVLFLLATSASAGPTDTPARANLSVPSQAVCNLLHVDVERCAAKIAVLSSPSNLRLTTSLELVRSIPTSRGSQVTLRCADATCSPFVVIVHGAALLSVHSSSRLRPQARAACPVAPGSALRYLDQSDAMRVTLPVVALERGCIGTSLRVRELQGRRIRRGTLAPTLEVIANQQGVNQ